MWEQSQYCSAHAQSAGFCIVFVVELQVSLVTKLGQKWVVVVPQVSNNTES